MKLLKVSAFLLVVVFAMACNNNEPATVETTPEAAPANTTVVIEKPAPEPDKKNVEVKVDGDGVGIKYERKD